jgi:hypothetical protein
MTTIGKQPNEGSAIHEYGDLDVLRYEDVQLPVPGPGGCGSASRRRRSSMISGGSGV